MTRKLLSNEKRWQQALANGWAFSKNLYLKGWREAPKTQSALGEACRVWWDQYINWGMPEDYELAA